MNVYDRHSTQYTDTEIQYTEHRYSTQTQYTDIHTEQMKGNDVEDSIKMTNSYIKL